LNINKISDQGIYSLGFGTFETFKILWNHLWSVVVGLLYDPSVTQEIFNSRNI
jgi:hypothetical protein